MLILSNLIVYPNRFGASDSTSKYQIVIEALSPILFTWRSSFRYHSGSSITTTWKKNSFFSSHRIQFRNCKKFYNHKQHIWKLFILCQGFKPACTIVALSWKHVDNDIKMIQIWRRNIFSVNYCQSAWISKSLNFSFIEKLPRRLIIPRARAKSLCNWLI